MFSYREVEVVVYEPEGTDYPSGNPLQERFPMEALDRVERGEGLVYVDADERSKRRSSIRSTLAEETHSKVSADLNC